MTEKAISPLRQRLIEDMTIRRLGPKTQHHSIRHVKSFADFLGRSANTATAEDVHRYQLRLASIGATVPTVDAGATALRFFFKVTLKRSDLADAVVSARRECRCAPQPGSISRRNAISEGDGLDHPCECRNLQPDRMPPDGTTFIAPLGASPPRSAGYSRRSMLAPIKMTGTGPLFSTRCDRGPNSANT